MGRSLITRSKINAVVRDHLVNEPVLPPRRNVAIYAACIGLVGLVLLVWKGIGSVSYMHLGSDSALWLWMLALFLSQRMMVTLTPKVSISFEEVYLLPMLLLLPTSQSAFILLVLIIISIPLGGKWGWVNACYSLSVLSLALLVADQLRPLVDHDMAWILTPIVLLTVTLGDIIIFGASVLMASKQQFMEFITQVVPTQALQFGVLLPISMLSTMAAAINETAMIILLLVPLIVLRLLGKRLVEASTFKAANAARAQAIRVASHELKTPLTTVSGFVQTLLAHDMPEEQRQRCLEIISDQSTRMQSIIDDLLVYSKLTGDDTHQLHVEPVDVKRIALSARGGVPDPDRIEINVPENMSVMADQQILERALINLLSNAIKYAPEGVITVQSHIDPDGRTCIEVWDRGPGVEPEFQSRLFSEFARSDAARTSSVPGTGLGLAIVRASMRSLGGDAYYNDRIEHGDIVGSIFGLKLPAT